MRRVLMLVGTGALLLLAALIVSVTVPFGTVALRSRGAYGAQRYAARGPQPVGMRDLAIEDNAPLGMVIWYPAENGVVADAQISYSYNIGMPAPLGMAAACSTHSVPVPH